MEFSSHHLHPFGWTHTWMQIEQNVQMTNVAHEVLRCLSAIILYHGQPRNKQ